MSPATFGERCPINDYYSKIYFRGSEAEKQALREMMWKKEGWYVNAYVISDGGNAENNGKVKVVDLGFGLYKLVERAMNGEFDKAWTAQANAYRPKGMEPIEVHVGKKIFDISDNGVNLLIRVRKNQAGMNDYKTSEFTLVGAELGLNNEQATTILNSCHDLTKLDRVVDVDTIVTNFRDNYIGFDTNPAAAPAAPAAQTPSPMSAFMSTPTAPTVVTNTQASAPAPAPVATPSHTVSAPAALAGTNPFVGNSAPAASTPDAPSDGAAPSFDTEGEMEDFLNRWK